MEQHFSDWYSRNGTLHVHVHDEYMANSYHTWFQHMFALDQQIPPLPAENTLAIPRSNLHSTVCALYMISTRFNRAQRQSFTSIELYLNWLIQFALESMRRIWCVWMLSSCLLDVQLFSILPWPIATFGRLAGSETVRCAIWVITSLLFLILLQPRCVRWPLRRR